MATTAGDLARWNRRRLLIIWITIATLVIGGFVGYTLYKPWRMEKLDRGAQAAMDRQDYFGASLKARRALQIDPHHLPAVLIMAEIAGVFGDERAVDWRARVTQLTGGSTPSLIAYASTAVNFAKHEIAKSVLDQVPEADKRSVDYQAVAGALALDSGDLVAAEGFFANAAELDPTNAAHRFALARTQVGSNDFFRQESGRKLLTELTKIEAFRLRALRELVTSYVMTGEPQAALRECHALIACTDHTFSDELQYLQLLRDTGDDGLPAPLMAAKQKAAANVKNAGALLIWMGNSGLATEALKWATKEAPDVGRMPGLEPGFAACYLALGNWAKLLNVTANGPWPDDDFIRHAYRARACREQNLGGFSDTEWQSAINAAANEPAALEPAALNWLVEKARDWKWSLEEEKALWAVISRSPKATWALEALYQRYLREKNTLGIRRVAAHLLKIDPSNESAQNDFAMSSVLLDHEVERARDMASVLYRKHPANVAYASTYAFALLAAGQANRALQVLETFPPTDLETPAVAAYYGMALAAADAPEKARRFLTIARDATFLPEEQAWITKAERQISLASPPKP